MEHLAVIFYKEEIIDGQSDILAVFPNELNDRQGNLVCYSHVGQHSGASPDYIDTLLVATEQEAAELKRELESMGYNLNVIKQAEIRFI